jgi:ABC-2 type transport system ATP-binding protein
VSEFAISIANLVVERGATRAVDDVSIDITAGKITGLLGPSGSGKSSLMRAIVGVQIITSGTITVFGETAGRPTLRSRVGYVTQAPSVYRDLTVLENLHYFGKILRAPAGDVDRVLEAVDLADLRHRLVGTLSGGQEGRVSLATALLGSPELLILDEPTVGLDPVLRRDLWALFHSLADDGLTLVISSHVMDEASRCHDLILLRSGRLLANGTQDELLRRTGAADIEAAFLALVESDVA